MADISKKLKLIPELDDSKIKRQIASLKKDLEGLKIDNQDLSGFNRSANLLKDAAKELRKAVEDLKRVSSSGSRGGLNLGGGRGASQAAQSGRELFDPQRGRYVRLPTASHVYNQETGKKFKSKEDEQAFISSRSQMLRQREEREKQKAADKQIKEEHRMRKAAARKEIAERERSTKNFLVAALRQMGVGIPQGRVITEAASGRLEGGFTGFGRRMHRRAFRGMRKMGIGSGLARGALGLLGAVGGALGIAGAAAGAVGLGAQSLVDYEDQQREVRQLRATRNQEQALSLVQGQGLQANLQRFGRRNAKGEVAGGIAGGVGSLFSLKGAGAILTDAATFGAAGRTSKLWSAGYESGKLGTQQKEIETLLAENQLGLEANRRVRSLRDARMGALRGGGIRGGNLTMLQGAGARNGFSAEETLSQFMQARQFLGNRGAESALPGMQNIFNRTGVDIGAQAQAAETFTGARRGSSTASGVSTTVEVLKRGVAAGLDASKSGKFLQTTADFISQNQGLGQMNVGTVSTNLANLAQGFAGGGPVTTTSLRQAQQLATMQRGESMAGGGLSGVGNLIGLQEALGPNATNEQMIAGMRLSSTATVEDTMEALGVDRATAERIVASKQDNQARGLEAIGVGADSILGRAFGAGERGIALEEQLGARRARRGRMGALQDLPDVGGGEFESRQAEFTVQQEQFTSGLRLMTVETEATKDSMETLKKQIDKAVKSLESYNQVLVNRKGP